MKLKKIFFILFFVVSLLIVIFLSFFEFFCNLREIFDILKYEQACLEYRYSGKDDSEKEFKNGFLEESGGVFATIQFLDSNRIVPVYCNRSVDNVGGFSFCGDFLEGNCVIIDVENGRFFENCLKEVENLDIEDELIFNLFGENKKVKVEKINLVSGINEKFYCENNVDSLNIFVNLPYSNSEKILIEAKNVDMAEKEESDLVSLFFKNRYILMFSATYCVVSVMFLVLLIAKICRFFKRGKVVKKKYMPKFL